ncbi:MAG: GAF domain-containing protein [Anaerolineales bacterium]|nr:MAG: GAF domain-containing protein [Anaerolineales bacterium]
MVSPVTHPQPVDQREVRGSLVRRLPFIILPLILIPLISLGVGAFLSSRNLMEEQAASQMTSAAQAQVQVLQEWTDINEQRLQLGSQRSALREAASELLRRPASSSSYRAAQTSARTELEDIRIRQGQVLFSGVLLARSSDGTILVSTNPDWEDQASPFLKADAIDPISLATYPFYNDPLFAPGNLVLISSAPLRASGAQEGELLLIGVNRDTRLGTLLEEMQIFWEQRGIYRVERGRTFVLLAPDIVIELPRYATELEAISGQSHPVFASIGDAASGTVEYTNKEGDLVLAAYEWIPDWDLGIVTELPQSDIFADANALAPFTIAMLAGASIFSIVIVGFVANRFLLRPLRDLTELAERLSRGDWSFRVPSDRDDEIGALAHSLNTMADELNSLYQSLEDRVEERTRQVRTAGEVARAVISIASLDELLRRAVELIQQQFKYDYVSIFLIEEDGDFAALHEATGEIGKALAAEGYIVPVGSASIIGWVTSNNQPRLVTDIQADDPKLRRDLMKDMRSELAVPLQTGGRVLGAMNVQSSKTDAFRPQDVEMLQTLADQLSAAILNARLAKTSAIAADRARLVSEVTSELSGSLEIEEVLEKAARALQRGLGNPEVIIKIHGEETTGLYTGTEV